MVWKKQLKVQDTKIFKTMKQGYNARLDESLGNKHKGKHKQSLKDRRDESKAMSKKDYGHAYGGDHGMKYEKHLGNNSKIFKK
jgi:hypothetical protein